MATEKQKSIAERRFNAGLKNPKKDRWAKRPRPMSRPAPAFKKIPKETIDDFELIGKELKWYQEIYQFIKKIWK